MVKYVENKFDEDYIQTLGEFSYAPVYLLFYFLVNILMRQFV